MDTPFSFVWQGTCSIVECTGYVKQLDMCPGQLHLLALLCTLQSWHNCQTTHLLSAAVASRCLACSIVCCIDAVWRGLIGVCECVDRGVVCCVGQCMLLRAASVGVCSSNCSIHCDSSHCASMLPTIECSRLCSSSYQEAGDAGAIPNQAHECLLFITGPYLRGVVRGLA